MHSNWKMPENQNDNNHKETNKTNKIFTLESSLSSEISFVDVTGDCLSESVPILNVRQSKKKNCIEAIETNFYSNQKKKKKKMRWIYLDR